MPQQQTAIPPDLLELSQRLEQWRSEQPPRTRLPESIWAAAVEMAQRYGLHRTTKTLRLDYTKLKKRMPAAGQATEPIPPGFLELLTPAAAAGPAEYVVECELSASMRSRRAGRGLIRVVGPETAGCPCRHCDRRWPDRRAWASEPDTGRERASSWGIQPGSLGIYRTVWRINDLQPSPARRTSQISFV